MENLLWENVSFRYKTSIGKNQTGNKEEMMNKSELGGFSADWERLPCAKGAGQIIIRSANGKTHVLSSSSTLTHNPSGTACHLPLQGRLGEFTACHLPLQGRLDGAAKAQGLLVGKSHSFGVDFSL